MSLTTVDPRTALLVVDLQEGIVGLPTAHPAADVVGRAASLAAAFRPRKLPVVLINVAGGAPGRNEIPRSTSGPKPNWTDLVPRLQASDDDHLVTKKRWNAFYGTSLHEYLQSADVTQVVIAGIATSIGVETTARSAHDHGYHVTLAIDAMTDLDAQAHDNSVGRVFPKLGETATTAELLTLLDQTHPQLRSSQEWHGAW
jgi:nicotinamidase-related amidase